MAGEDGDVPNMCAYIGTSSVTVVCWEISISMSERSISSTFRWPAGETPGRNNVSTAAVSMGSGMECVWMLVRVETHRPVLYSTNRNRVSFASRSAGTRGVGRGSIGDVCLFA